jgi:serine/threonine-protein kinase
MLLDRVAAGGTSTVYRAEDLVLGRTVAVKLLHDCFTDDDELVERFRREASTAANLDHPHIVAVYGRGESNGIHYIAMEYVRGRSLRSLIREEAPLAPARAIDLAVQLLLAVRCIHGRGIIHRDLKPHNAIVAAGGKLKLIDFGIARADESDITQTGMVIGTAQYVSPEQAQGNRVTFASDLYSIGVILYEMVTGHVPFEADTVVAVLLKHVKSRPAPPKKRAPRITDELNGIVMRALEKGPSSRFADADAFLAALEDARNACQQHSDPLEETRNVSRVS